MDMPTLDQEISRTAHVMRLTWAALLGGECGVGYFLLFYSPAFGQPRPELVGTVTVSLGLVLAVLIPLGYFVRMQVYKRGWRAHRITPQAYVFANLLLWSLMMAVVLVSVIGAYLTGSRGVALVPAVIGVLVQMVNYPNGDAMRSQPPEFVKK